MKKKLLFILLLLLLIFTGCAQIPHEAIKLNQLVHTNIEDIHNKHVNLTRDYFRLRVELFDEWFIDEYEPEYYSNYVKIWNSKNPTNLFDHSNDSHRGLYTQDSIAEHESYIKKIKKLEEDLIKKLDAGYTDILAANDAVTKLLESAKAVTDSQKNLWNKTVGQVIPSVEAEKIEKKIEKIQNKAFKDIGVNPKSK